MTQRNLQATGAGAKDQEAENFLEKKLKAGSSLSQAQTAQLAISALQSVLSEDFKPSEVEVRTELLTARGLRLPQLKLIRPCPQAMAPAAARHSHSAAGGSSFLERAVR